MSHPICYAELTTGDPVKAKEFYEKLFGWTFKVYPMPQGDYYMAGDEEETDGIGRGIMKTPQPGVPTAWTTYVRVQDIKAHTKKAADLGAKILMDVTPVPEYGFFSVLQDPTGAVIALWQCKEEEKK